MTTNEEVCEKHGLIHAKGFPCIVCAAAKVVESSGHSCESCFYHEHRWTHNLPCASCIHRASVDRDCWREK
jgi:hypothetical protein